VSLTGTTGKVIQYLRGDLPRNTPIVERVPLPSEPSRRPGTRGEIKKTGSALSGLLPEKKKKK
jgi:hypothetical protein